MANNLPGIPFSTPDEGTDHPHRAKRLVLDHVKSKNIVTEAYTASHMGMDDVYVVWYAYVLGGWKALVSTTIPDGRYYEVTYDKNKKQTYLDEYIKTDNICIPDGE